MTETRRYTRLDHDERRRQILAAARALFSERHYSSVSLREIAARAGVAPGLLHHYFDSKHDLYLHVARDMLRVPTMPLPARRGRASVEQLWSQSVDGWLDVIDENREMWLNAMRAGETGDDPELRRILDEASEVVVERVLEALDLDAATAPPALRAVVRSYGGLAQEATREWLERRRLTREQVRVLLIGTMPLIARELVPDILAARPRSRPRPTT